MALSVAAAELWRIAVRPEDALPSAGGGGRALEYTPAQAVQMRPLYEIAGGESGAAAALAAVGAWQLAIALAEEVYYRGFLQSAGRLALTALPPGLPATVLEGLPLAVAAAVFGLVHTEFVDAVEGDGDDSKLRWFAITGAYGAGLRLALRRHRPPADRPRRRARRAQPRALRARLAADAGVVAGGAGEDIRSQA